MADVRTHWQATRDAILRSIVGHDTQAARAAEVWDAMTAAVDADHLEAITDMARESVRKMSVDNQRRFTKYKNALLESFRASP